MAETNLGKQSFNTKPLSLSSPGSSMGLAALREELNDQGISDLELLEGTGIQPAWFESYNPPLTHEQRIIFIRNAKCLAVDPRTALRAGNRQRISDFGVYGYAMISSATFGEAVNLAFMHRELAGSVLRISREEKDNIVIFKTQHPLSLGGLLPFVAEFWRSTITSLFSQILGSKFIARAMYFPYEKPKYSNTYHETFNCTLHFNADTMEWHVDTSLLKKKCPKANKITAKVCTRFCEQIIKSHEIESKLQKKISMICLGRPGHSPTGSEVAAELGISRRSLFRRLNDEGVSYQYVLDKIRQSLAIEYLASTRMSVEEIAYRIGFSDSSNFRKAFKRWTQKKPSDFRNDT